MVSGRKKRQHIPNSFAAFCGPRERVFSAQTGYSNQSTCRSLYAKTTANTMSNGCSKDLTNSQRGTNAFEPSCLQCVF